MQTTKVTLLSGKGKVTDAIIDSLPDKYVIHRVIFSDDNFQEVLNTERKNLMTADVIILNLSEVNGNNDNSLSIANGLYQQFPVIVLHHYNQKTFADAFIKMGAKAYLPINFYPDSLTTVIEQVLSPKTS